jgi:hypothetical protein
MQKLEKFPHNDQLVLHAPKECKICDQFPERQALRESWGVDFTGKRTYTKTKCPSEQRRDLETIYALKSNHPVPYLGAIAKAILMLGTQDFKSVGVVFSETDPIDVINQLVEEKISIMSYSKVNATLHLGQNKYFFFKDEEPNRLRGSQFNAGITESNDGTVNAILAMCVRIGETPMIIKV